MPETIGDRIKYLRERHDMTRTALAKLTYINRTTISRWESGEAAPRVDDIARLSQIFNVSCDYIIKGNNE